MKKILCFLYFLCFTLSTTAKANVCQSDEILQDNLKITFNYGKILFDVSKTTQEVSSICEDSAAGCFLRKEKGGKWIVSDKIVKIGNQLCVVPHVSIIYDFSGSKIYVSREYDACKARAVLRHELQHFMIWKTSKEWFLKDLRYSLKNTIKKHAVLCSKNNSCSTHANSAISQTISQVEKRWEKIEEQNQYLLDSVDHSVTDQVNYPVCAPYSLRVNSF